LLKTDGQMLLLALLHPVISMLILLRIMAAFFVDTQKNKTMFNSKE